jgi:hypothetical protein
MVFSFSSFRSNFMLDVVQWSSVFYAYLDNNFVCDLVEGSKLVITP